MFGGQPRCLPVPCRHLLTTAPLGSYSADPPPQPRPGPTLPRTPPARPFVTVLLWPRGSLQSGAPRGRFWALWVPSLVPASLLIGFTPTRAGEQPSVTLPRKAPLLSLRAGRAGGVRLCSAPLDWLAVQQQHFLPLPRSCLYPHLLLPRAVFTQSSPGPQTLESGHMSPLARSPSMSPLTRLGSRTAELMPDPLAESTPRHQERCGGQTQGKSPKSLQEAKASAF